MRHCVSTVYFRGAFCVCFTVYIGTVCVLYSTEGSLCLLYSIEGHGVCIFQYRADLCVYCTVEGGNECVFYITVRHWVCNLQYTEALCVNTTVQRGANFVLYS